MAVTRRAFLIASSVTLALPAEKPGAAAVHANGLKAAGRSASDLQELIDGAGTSAVVRGTWNLDATVRLPPTLTSLELASDARVVAQGNFPAFERRGSVEVLGTTPSLPEGATQFVPPFGNVRAGDVLFLAGHDTIPSSPDKYGYLRKVTSISSGVLTLDRPLPRKISINPRCGRVDLAPPIKIFGSGKVSNSNPSGSTKPLMDFFAVDNLSVDRVEIFDNGGPGITVAHCWGGVVSAWIHDLLDDGQTHFGYGVNVSGATRDLRVSGSAARVRHAVTTNPGPPTEGFGNAGEPESCVFSIQATDCSDKAIDTHRAGWGTLINPDVRGGRGGVQVRADNTRVVGGSITGTMGPGIAVHASVAVPPVIDGVSIGDLWPSGNAILALSPVAVNNVTVRDCAWTNIVLNSDSRVVGGSISAGHPTGVEFRGSNNIVSGISLGESVTTPYTEAAGVIGNSFSAASAHPAMLAAPTCTAPPLISGTVAVGVEVSATAGSWSNPRLKFSWTWLRDGAPISNAIDRNYPRYVVTKSDIGARITVRVTARRTGYEPGRANSAPSALVGNAGSVEVVVAPKVSGTAQPGKFLYVTRGEWNPYPSSVTFQWLRNGVAIPGATTSGYQVRTTDVEFELSVRATANKSGYQNGSVVTGATPVPRTPLTMTTAPELTGSGRAGTFLYVSRGVWNPYATAVTYQWTVNGSPVPGATSGGYLIRAADVGKAVSVLVTARRVAWSNGTFRPAAIKI